VSGAALAEARESGSLGSSATSLATMLSRWKVVARAVLALVPLVFSLVPSVGKELSGVGVTLLTFYYL
jgi:hypothetical protein